ncbi:hypothetical protein [Aestuariivirga litoralis]|nr:hypothetical protein [Aestuariivirga litoralis]
MTDDSHSYGAPNRQEDEASPGDAATQAETGLGDVLGQPASEAPRLPPREPLRRPPPAAAGQARLQPSWILSATGEQLTRDEILARYRRQRGLPEHPFENGVRPVPPPGYRDRIMTQPRPARFMARAAEPEPPPMRTPRTFTVGQTIAIAAAAAVMAGGGAVALSMLVQGGFVPGGLAPAGLQALAVAPPAEAQAAPLAPKLELSQAASQHDTVIDKKPIATATLQVADVTGETNSFIPLALHAEPAGLGNDMLLKISGVPEGAYLTSGRRQDDQVWTLSLADIKNVKLVVPQTDDPQIDLAVAAFEPKTGELAAPVKTMTVALKDVVVEPTSAPPPGQMTPTTAEARPNAPAAADPARPAAIPPPQSVGVALSVPETAQTQELITRGDQLFRSGDVKMALRSYERAWGNDGSAAAAFGIARSHDPLVLAALAANNGTPNRDQAILWYQRAAAAGNPQAAEAIVKLQMGP